MRLLTLLLPLALLSQTSAAALIYPSDEEKERWAVFTQAQELFLQKNFDALEHTADELLAKEARFSDGEWKLPAFLDGLRASAETDASKWDWDKTLAILDEWKTARPDSIWQPVARARYHIEHAWDARGTGYARTVSEEGWKLFHERLAAARRVLMEAPPRARDCPAWHSQLLTVILGALNNQGWTEQQVSDAFTAALRSHPSYYDNYKKIAHHLLPRWHGEPGDWERFAAEIARSHPSEGNAICARIAWSLSRYYTNIFEETALEWPLVRDGYRQILKQTGNNLWNLNAFCWFASLAGDGSTIAELLPLISDRAYQSVWGSEERFNRAKRQADAAAGRLRLVQSRLRLAPAGDASRFGGALAAAFSPDGRSVITGYSDGQLITWDTATGKALNFLRLNASISDAAFSPDGTLLAVCTSRNEKTKTNGRLWLLKMPGFLFHKTLEPWEGSIHVLRFSPDGEKLAFGGQNTQKRAENHIHNLKTGETFPAPWPEKHHHPIYNMAFTQDGRCLAVNCTRDISILDLATGKDDTAYRTSGALPAQANDIVSSPDGKSLFAAVGWTRKDSHKPGGIAVWDNTSPGPETPKWTLRPSLIPAPSLVDMAVSPDGSLLAAGSHHGSVIFFRASDGREIARGELHDGMINAVAFSRDGKTLVSASSDGTVRLWDVPQPH